MIVTGFGESCNLVREGKMFVKDKAEIASRVRGAKRRTADLGKLLLFFESDKLECSFSSAFFSLVT